MKLFVQLAPRTLVAAIRTSLYGSVAAFFALSGAEAKSLVDGIVIGAVLADFLTWLVMSIVSLPGHLAHGVYEACLYLAFALCLIQFGGCGHLAELDEGTLSVAFPVFMLVLALKGFWYAARYVTQVDEG